MTNDRSALAVSIAATGSGNSWAKNFPTVPDMEQQVATGDAVEHAPHFALGIDADIRRRRLATRVAVQVEAQAIAFHAANAPLGRLHAAPLPEGAVVHVGAVGEVPHRIGRVPLQYVAVPAIVVARQEPGFCQEPAPAGADCPPRP